MDDLFKEYRPDDKKRRDWLNVLLKKGVETFLRRNSKRALAEHVPQFFIVSQDHISNRVMLHGVYERGLLDAAMVFLKRNDQLVGSAVDAGANIGNHSLYLSQFYERVFSFEPNPKLSLVLRANAALTNNVTCLQFGLSDESSDSTLHVVNGYNLGASTVVAPEKLANTESLGISLVSLDSVAELAECHIGLFKIDVESWEINVLRGASSTLDRCSPVIFFEQQKECFPDDGSDSPVVAHLRGKGYSHFYEIDIFPRVSWIGVKHLRNLAEHVIRVALGYRYEVRPVQKFHKRFYSFIIASKRELQA